MRVAVATHDPFDAHAVTPQARNRTASTGQETSTKFVTLWARCTTGRLAAIIHDMPALQHYTCGDNGQIGIAVAHVPALEAELDARGIEHGLV